MVEPITLLYRLFTVEAGQRPVSGIAVKTIRSKYFPEPIPGIVLGENDRGGFRRVVSVHLLPETYLQWEKGEKVFIETAELGKSGNGNPKLFCREVGEVRKEEMICLLLPGPKMAGRFGGQRIGWSCGQCGRNEWGDKPTKCNSCQDAEQLRVDFADFPGTILVRGVRQTQVESLAKMPIAIFRSWDQDGGQERYYMWDGAALRSDRQERLRHDLLFEHLLTPGATFAGWDDDLYDPQ